MKKTKKKASLLTILLCVLAGCLILVGGIGGTRAVLTTSATYHGTLETPEVNVQLYENTKPIDNNGTLAGLAGTTLEIGKPVKEEVTVENTGTAKQYVRVTFYQYWTDGENKRVDLDPGYIKLTHGSTWALDEAASKAPERTVVYYTKELDAGETTDTPALTTVTVDNDIKLLVTKKVDGDKTIYEYKYDGLTMNLEVSVDAIQAHHAQDAMEASWGTTNVIVNEAEGTLSVH